VSDTVGVKSRLRQECVGFSRGGMGARGRLLDEGAVAHAPAWVAAEQIAKDALVEEGRDWVDADAGSVTGPGPLRRLAAETGPYRVVSDVAASREEVRLGIDQLCEKPVPEQMRATAIDAVEVLRVTAVELLQRHRQTPIRCLHNQVVVVAHQTVRDTAELEPLDKRRKPVHERLTVSIVDKQRAPIAPARGDVIHAARNKLARPSRHASTLASAPRIETECEDNAPFSTPPHA